MSLQLTDLKNQASSMLANSQAIMDLLTNGTDTPMTEAELKEHLVSHWRNPATMTGEGSYVFFDLEADRGQGDAFLSYSIRFLAVSSAAVLWTDAGLRTDLLAQELDLLFDRSREMGVGPLSLTGTSVPTVPDGYYARELRYQASVLNRRR